MSDTSGTTTSGNSTLLLFHSPEIYVEITFFYLKKSVILLRFPACFSLSTFTFSSLFLFGTKENLIKNVHILVQRRSESNYSVINYKIKLRTKFRIKGAERGKVNWSGVEEVGGRGWTLYVELWSKNMGQAYKHGTKEFYKFWKGVFLPWYNNFVRNRGVWEWVHRYSGMLRYNRLIYRGLLVL